MLKFNEVYDTPSIFPKTLNPSNSLGYIYTGWFRKHIVPTAAEVHLTLINSSQHSLFYLTVMSVYHVISSVQVQQAATVGLVFDLGTVAGVESYSRIIAWGIQIYFSDLRRNLSISGAHEFFLDGKRLGSSGDFTAPSCYEFLTYRRCINASSSEDMSTVKPVLCLRPTKVEWHVRQRGLSLENLHYISTCK